MFLLRFSEVVCYLLWLFLIWPLALFLFLSGLLLNGLSYLGRTSPSSPIVTPRKHCIHKSPGRHSPFCPLSQTLGPHFTFEGRRNLFGDKDTYSQTDRYFTPDLHTSLYSIFEEELEENMGARQSKRSVDISSTPKKEKLEGGQEEKLEKIEEGDVKVQNGTAAHTEGSPQESSENQPKENANESESAAVSDKTEPAVTESGDATPAATVNGEAEKKEEGVTTPETEKKTEEQPKTEEKSDKKKKDKPKKKWSFRSISFSKKDKSKPSMSRDESKSNDLAKEAPVPEETATKSGSEEASPSEPEASTPAIDEASKEIVPIETKEEETTLVTTDIKNAISTLTSAAESEVKKIVEETNVVTTEAKEAINTIVEAGSKLVVEESKTTTITESASIITTSTKTIEIVEETIAPPLPASPPPTEAPPPTPVAPQPAQHEHEAMNGGGESMAEMPEENGLGENEKLDDQIIDEIIPKVNGHNESPVQIEEITECLLKTSIEDKIVLDNHLDVAVEDGKTQE